MKVILHLFFSSVLAGSGISGTPVTLDDEIGFFGVPSEFLIVQNSGDSVGNVDQEIQNTVNLSLEDFKKKIHDKKDDFIIKVFHQLFGQFSVVKNNEELITNEFKAILQKISTDKINDVFKSADSEGVTVFAKLIAWPDDKSKKLFDYFLSFNPNLPELLLAKESEKISHAPRFFRYMPLNKNFAEFLGGKEKIWEIFDEKVNNHFDEKVNNHLDEKVNNHLDEKVNNHLDEKVNNHLDEKVNNHIEFMLLTFLKLQSKFEDKYKARDVFLKVLSHYLPTDNAGLAEIHDIKINLLFAKCGFYKELLSFNYKNTANEGVIYALLTSPFLFFDKKLQAITWVVDQGCDFSLPVNNEGKSPLLNLGIQDFNKFLKTFKNRLSKDDFLQKIEDANTDFLTLCAKNEKWNTLWSIAVEFPEQEILTVVTKYFAEGASDKNYKIFIYLLKNIPDKSLDLVTLFKEIDWGKAPENRARVGRYLGVDLRPVLPEKVKESIRITDSIKKMKKKKPKRKQEGEILPTSTINTTTEIIANTRTTESVDTTPIPDEILPASTINTTTEIIDNTRTTESVDTTPIPAAGNGFNSPTLVPEQDNDPNTGHDKRAKDVISSNISEHIHTEKLTNSNTGSVADNNPVLRITKLTKTVNKTTPIPAAGNGSNSPTLVPGQDNDPKNDSKTGHEQRAKDVISSNTLGKFALGATALGALIITGIVTFKYVKNSPARSQQASIGGFKKKQNVSSKNFVGKKRK